MDAQLELIQFLGTGNQRRASIGTSWFRELFRVWELAELKIKVQKLTSNHFLFLRDPSRHKPKVLMPLLFQQTASEIYISISQSDPLNAHFGTPSILLVGKNNM